MKWGQLKNWEFVRDPNSAHNEWLLEHANFQGGFQKWCFTDAFKVLETQNYHCKFWLLSTSLPFFLFNFVKEKGQRVLKLTRILHAGVPLHTSLGYEPSQEAWFSSIKEYSKKSLTVYENCWLSFLTQTLLPDCSLWSRVFAPFDQLV